ncbi:MAG: hypothetical protein ACFCUT_06465 [Kiloniellaceae bacterium]
MKTLLFAAVLTASLALALSLIGSAARAGCPSYDPNCDRPCPAGTTC